MNDVKITAVINNMTISQRKDGRYEGRLTVNGKRKGFYGSNKTEVKRKAREYFHLVENGYKEPKKIFEEIITENFPNIKKETLKFRKQRVKDKINTRRNRL